MPEPRDGTSVTLLARLRASDDDAWNRLVALYGPFVRYWLERGGAAGADADDLSQDVFREVHRALPGFRRDRPEDTFRGWLRGVARNVLLRHARSASRQPQAAGGTHALEHLHALPDTPAGEEDDPPGERNALYRRALGLVKGDFEEKTWQMFWDSTAGGRTPAEVASALGVSTAAVRQAKSRVLRRLKEEVGDVLD